MSDRAAHFQALARDIVGFWRSAGAGRWYRQDSVFDAQVRRRLGRWYDLAATGDLAAMAETPEGAMALLILLDQAPRNMFRGTPRAFETDAQAREVAWEGVRRGFDSRVVPPLRPLFYLPFMHSEDLLDQDFCVALYRERGTPDGLAWAEVHREIIARFGRFPHRNPILGREMSDEEAGFLAEGGFRG
jgi:uncharacterized protein (DUF924 family)